MTKTHHCLSRTSRPCMVKNIARRLRNTFTLSMPRITNSLWSRALPAHSLMSQQSTGVCEPFNDSDHGWSQEYRACWCFQQHHGHAAVHLRYWCTYGETNYRLSDHTNWPCSTYFLYNRNRVPLEMVPCKRLPSLEGMQVHISTAGGCPTNGACWEARATFSSGTRYTGHFYAHELSHDNRLPGWWWFTKHTGGVCAMVGVSL